MFSVGIHETAGVCTRAAEPESRRGGLCAGGLWAAAWADRKVAADGPQPAGLLAAGAARRYRGPAQARPATSERRCRPCSRPFAAPVGALGGPARLSRHLITGAAVPRRLRHCCSVAEMASTSRYGGGPGAGNQGRSGSGSGIAPVCGTGRKWPRRPHCRPRTDRRPSALFPGPGAAGLARLSRCPAHRPLSGVRSVRAAPCASPGAAGGRTSGSPRLLGLGPAAPG